MKASTAVALATAGFVLTVSGAYIASPWLFWLGISASLAFVFPLL